MRAIILSRILPLLLFISAATTLHADPNDLVNQAWKAWSEGDQKGAETKLLDALKADPGNARANLGLSFLYGSQRNYAVAWKAYESALGKLPSRYPYLYAAWVTPLMTMNFDDSDLGLLPMVKELAERGDSLGVVRAMANERLAGYYRYRNRPDDAQRHADAMHCINDWMVVGPFDNVSASGHDKVYQPEGAFDAIAMFEGKNGIPAWWFTPVAMRRDNWVDFTRYFANYNSVFYANTFVYSPEKRRIHFRIGTSGSFKAFLNDELVNETIDEYNNDLDTYIAETELQQGWNRILIKCGFSDIQRCNFMLRLTDLAGNALPGLQVKSAAQDYKSKPGAATKRFGNFAEEYFKDRIARHPAEIENYLLLADCYLRNDKAIDAELVLRSALEQAPNTPIIYERLVEAYQRGDKSDEIEKAYEKIYAIDSKALSALEYKFEQYMETEDYDKAGGIMNEFEKLRPESPELYSMQIQYYAKKEETEKIINLCEKAYARFPRNSQFAMMQALMTAQISRNPEEAIKIYQDYLDEELDETIMSSQAAAYLSMSDLKSWRRIYDRLIELSPPSPGYYYTMANTYFTARVYDVAEEMMKRAIAISPTNSTLWSKLGEIHRIEGMESSAIIDYEKALLYDPTDYDARAALRELRGQASIFEQFEKVDIDSILRHARTMKVDSEEAAMVVFESAQHVVYEKGASEAVQEMVVKVLNGRGIDDWKEYVIPHNRYNEELIIDKAVTVKSDGSETKADVDESYVVFKTLEENDVIHLKWHIKNHYSGKLSNHFFDTYYFNGFYPAQHVRYELLAPKGFTFNYKAQNMKSEPAKREVEDGVIHRWTLDNVPAVSYEYEMPTLDDVGSVLYISSITNWEYMVDWYTDIATTKARGSYEIKEKVRDLLKGKETASDDEKMKAIYNFITENIRYSSVGFRQGAHIPQKARDVLVNRIGDCKDVAALCIAMLREAGMKAHFVLVNTRDEGLNRNALPSIAFNHCIVAVETGGGEKYLDLTANNYPIGSMPEGDIEAFALVIKPGVKKPIYLPAGSVPRNIIIQTSADLRDDNTLRATRSTIATGTLAAAIRQAFRDQARKEQEKRVLASISSGYPNVKLTSFAIDNINTLTPDARFSYECEIPSYLSDAGSFKLLRVPWARYAEPDRALSYEKREYPYVYWPGEDTVTEEITIAIPDGYAPIDLPAGTKLTSRVADYSVKYTFIGGKLTARRQLVNKKSIVELEEYAEFKRFHGDMVKEDTRQILLKPKGKK